MQRTVRPVRGKRRAESAFSSIGVTVNTKYIIQKRTQKGYYFAYIVKP